MIGEFVLEAERLGMLFWGAVSLEFRKVEKQKGFMLVIIKERGRTTERSLARPVLLIEEDELHD